MNTTQPLQRKDAPLESTWAREEVYESWVGWQAEFDTAMAELPELSGFSDTLDTGPAALLEWFAAYSRQWRRAMKLFMFTRMAVLVNTGDLEAKQYYGKAMSLMAKLGATTAFAEPALSQIGDTLLAWANEEPQLDRYRHYFDNLLRNRAHQRSPEIEELLSLLEEPFEGVSQTADELTNTDMKFAEAVDSRGGLHPVRQATITPTGIQNLDRELRRTAWESFCDGHLALQNTLASNYMTNIRQWQFLARARDYDSVLEMMLSPSNLPVSVFHNIISTFEENLSVWHRYWAVKRKMLGVDALHPYDIWAPIVANPPQISYGQAVDWICEALTPLGQTYVDVMRRGCLEERWVDYAPNVGKMQGAASSLRVDMPPFIYMSYEGDMMSLSVLAHELGHSMHGYLTDENQPQVYSNFEVISMAVAETASNFHQAMLRAYLQEAKKDDREFQIALIDEAMFNFHRYFFQMPTLARFEFEAFRRAGEGETLTAPTLNQMMRELYAAGYGETMVDDPERTAITWAEFSHLYYPFYTFQYSVGISAATALADGILSGRPGAVESYLQMLAAGGAQYPQDLFSMAGVDMSTPEPITRAFGVLSRMVDRLEELA